MALASVCYATLPVLAKLAFSHGVNASGMLALRFGLSTPALIAYVVARRRPVRIGSGLRLVVPTALLYVLQTYCFLESLARMSASVAIVVIFTYPLLVYLGAAVFLGERFSPRGLGIVMAGTIGVLLSVSAHGQVNVAGVAYGLAGAVLFAGFMLLAKRVLSSGDYDGVTLTTVVYALCALTFPIVAVLAGGTLPNDATGWLAVCGVAVIGSALAAVLLFEGLRHLGAGVASMVSAVEPPVSVVLAAIFLSEPITLLQVIGIALLVSALIVLGRTPVADAAFGAQAP